MPLYSPPDSNRVPRERLWSPASATASENYHRIGAGLTNGGTNLASGRLSVVGGAVLSDGFVINSVTFLSGTTAANTPLNQWFAVIDQNRNVLAKTNDDTTTAWASNTAKTLSVSPSVTVVGETAVWLGILVVATTVPTLLGVNTSLVSTAAPVIAGTSTTGLTTPASLTSPIQAPTANVASVAWCYVA